MKNLCNYLDASNDLYAVDFHAKNSACIFKGNDSGTLGDLIKLYGKSGILKIYRYNASKMKFERISKELVKQLFSWDTHSTEQLKRVNYIK
jgi:hypothetical protein